jgi:pimeloyl-ACP methyl ester carboxylesterase
MRVVVRLSGATILLAAVVIAVAGCGGSTPKPAPAPVVSARDPAGTIWLCRPGLADNPCLSSLTTTVLEAKGGSRVERVPATANPGVDCFYVYPTVSPEQTVNANREVDFALREVAIAQASRFSQVCRIWAPVYPQITLTALAHPSRITAANALKAYDGVAAAFRDYLAHYNDGRGIVFIGHSQGASILIRLLQREVDNTSLRRRLVGAILLGGNVTVRKGSLVGGDFAHIPECTSSSEVGCVIAYSSYSSKPPLNSEFARTGSEVGVGLLTQGNLSPDLQIMCVNPTSLGGGSGVLDPYFPTILVGLLPGATTQKVSSPWISTPNQYSARCETSGTATWLQVSPIAGERIALAGVNHALTGLHLIDVNAALGNLVPIVAQQAATYSRKHS